MKKFLNLALVIKIIHCMLIAFVVLVPFIGNEWWLTMHAIIVPSIIIHWLTNNNICSLTFLESKLSGVDVNNTFISKILFPFFEINNKIIYFITFGLLFVTLHRLNKTNFRLLRLTINMTYRYFMNIVMSVYNMLKNGINNIMNTIQPN